jgi:hypothetical protein
MQFNKIRCASTIAAPQRQDRIQISDFHPAGAKGTDPASAADPVHFIFFLYVRITIQLQRECALC